MIAEKIEWNGPRLAALWRFSLAITVFNLLGHLWFGFEQSFAQPLVAIATGYGCELLFETVDALANGRSVRYRGGAAHLVAFLLPAHITGLAVSMLLYANDQLWPMVFAVAVAIGSKYLFRVRVGGRDKHFLNPSNFGITVTLLVFHWVGIAMPYMFTRGLGPIGDIALPAGLFAAGLTLNYRFTKRIPLIATWLAAFFLQAVVKSLLGGTPLNAGLLPFTGVAFLLFTVYMVSDPSTTPSSVRGQIAFGSSLAVVYGILMLNHIVFTMFFALTIVCVGRGVLLSIAALRERASVGEGAWESGAAAGGVQQGIASSSSAIASAATPSSDQGLVG